MSTMTFKWKTTTKYGAETNTDIDFLYGMCYTGDGRILYITDEQQAMSLHDDDITDEGIELEVRKKDSTADISLEGFEHSPKTKTRIRTKWRAQIFRGAEADSQPDHSRG